MNFVSSGCLRATVSREETSTVTANRNLHGRNIDNHFEAQPLGEQIVGRDCIAASMDPALRAAIA